MIYGRFTNNRERPNLQSLKSEAHRNKQDIRNYAENIRGYFYNQSTDTIEYKTQGRGWGQRHSRAIIEYGVEARGVTWEDDWTLDLGDTGIDTSNTTGGLIDGISKENGRDYLVWLILDSNYEFEGLGLTRKPYSAFTGIGGDGTAAKGESGVPFTGLSDAYQFTIGARVAVRNQDGTAPVYEWNWGTVAAINSNTSIDIDMDNNSNYGSALTGATTGEIIQWDSLRPYVVTSSSQTLYSNHYSLLGELYTDSSSGDITHAYRADDPFRDAKMPEIINAGAGSSANVSLGRDIPLWAQQANIFAVLEPGLVGAAAQIDVYGLIKFFLRTQVVTVNIEGCSGYIDLENYTILNYTTAASAGDFIAYLIEYYVPGGMLS